MKKKIIEVPKGIHYLSDWEEFSLPDHPCIIDKKLTGCGFTEYVIREPFNAVLISPRKTLLENKVDQHNPKYPGTEIEIAQERVIYYAKADFNEDLGVDKDLQAKLPKESKRVELDEDSQEGKELIFKYKQDLKEAIFQFTKDLKNPKPIKICVTYDSFRKVKEVLEELGIIDSFYFVVDEFQSIFTDSRFKPDTEMEFVEELKKLQRVTFVSATPMMEEYLDLLQDFKYLPYYELDWQTLDPSRVISPDIIARSTRSINETAKKILTDFKEGKYQVKSLVDERGNPIQVVEARELVLYVNSVRNIADIIRQNKLTWEEATIICADTAENRKKIRDAFKVVYKELGRSTKDIPKEKDIISKVPTPDPTTGIVTNRPITLCTKTVYLGADFYSKCARSIVLSDASVECLAVDITLDLPQILGRQRDLDNPWKNSLEIWFKIGNGAKDITPEEFEKIIDEKTEATESLLRSYQNANEGYDKHKLAEKYLNDLKRENYKKDYVAINHHKGSDLTPQFNNLVMISEKRAYDIQQKDYKDRFTVFNKIGEVFGENIVDLSEEIQKMLDDINSNSTFINKMRCCCSYISAKGEEWINFLEDPYRTYFHALGIDYIVSVGWQKSKLDSAMVQRGMGRIFSKEDLEELVLGYFEVGKKYTKSQIKEDLGRLYKEVGIVSKPKAIDLEKWFELKRATTTIDGKRYEGFEIVKQK